MVDWIWSLCNKAFDESGIMPEDWRPVVIVPLYKGKGERTECKNYLVGKINTGILVDRIQGVTGDLIDDEQRGL